MLKKKFGYQLNLDEARLMPEVLNCSLVKGIPKCFMLERIRIADLVIKKICCVEIS